jgi:hypothetical protein
MKELFYKTLFYIGVTIAGIIFYFIGNLFFGTRNENGKRTVIAIAGIISGVLGFFMTKCFLQDLEKTSSALLGVFLGIIFLGFGVYLFFAALFASQKYIVKIFEGLLRSW